MTDEQSRHGKAASSVVATATPSGLATAGNSRAISRASLAPDFAVTEPGHPHPARERWTVERRTALLDELRDEWRRRRTAYPPRIKDGRMTQGEADRHLALIAAIGDDIARGLEVHDFTATPDGFTWEAKVHELRREIGLRRRFYPDWVSKGTLTAPEARQRLTDLLAVHWLYWVDDDFRYPPTTNPDVLAKIRASVGEHIAILDLTIPDWRGPFPDVVPELSTVQKEIAHV